MKSFSSASPIYIGLCGPAGSGKTSTAKSIVPTSSIKLYDDPSLFPDLVWSHLYFAIPLYEMVAAKQYIEGDDILNRTLYSLHEIAYSLTKRKIPYEDLIELVYDLYSMPCIMEGSKPRTFLQNAGSLCRSYYAKCFVDYIRYRVLEDYRSVCMEYDSHELDAPWYIAVISDVRQLNEAEMIRNQDNNFLIKFTASQPELDRRLLDRDGVLLSDKQANHESEREINEIPDEWFDLILDTTNLTLEEQAQSTMNFIKENSSVKDRIEND